MGEGLESLLVSLEFLLYVNFIDFWGVWKILFLVFFELMFEVSFEGGSVVGEIWVVILMVVFEVGMGM